MSKEQVEIDPVVSLHPVDDTTVEMDPVPSRDQPNFRYKLTYSRKNGSVAQRRPNLVTADQIANVGQYKFVALNSSQALCKRCASLSFANLISSAGVSHSWDGCATKECSTQRCSLCIFFWRALLVHLNETYSREPPSDDSMDWFGLSTGYEPPPTWYDFEDKAERLESLRTDPVSIFLNPLCPDPRGLTYGTWPYTISELSVWSATQDVLFRVKLEKNWYEEAEYAYHMPSLEWSMRDLSGLPDPREKASLDRALAMVKFVTKTSWSDPLARIVRHKTVVPDMQSSESVNMVKAWIENCEASHILCCSKEGNTVPSRLIDVGDGDSQQARLVLVSPEAMDVDRLRYVALSYCWGTKSDTPSFTESPEFATTEWTIKQYLISLPTELLPKTILDAIAFTKSLGVRYLWADSLCIMQGQSTEAREDWARESSKMASVYGGAWLTIAAAWGSSMHDGLFTIRPHDSTDHIDIGLESLEDDSCKGTLRLVPKHDLPVDSMEEPLYTRAWALQERVLSKRVLICNRDQFVWECQGHCFAESGFRLKSIGAMRLDQVFLDKLGSESMAFRNTWQCIVTDYCHKALTNPFDKLPAIGGLARKFHALRPDDTYLAGLWKNSLFDDLLWVHRAIDWYDNQGRYLMVAPTSLQKRNKPQGYRAPSWSWASIDGDVRWKFSHNNGTGKCHAQLLDYSLAPRGSDTFGQLRGGYITLRAPLWQLSEEMKRYLLDPNVLYDHAEFRKIVTYGEGREEETESERYRLQSWVSGATMDSHREGCSLGEILGDTKAENTDLFFLKVRDSISLILSSAKGSGGGAQRCYERVGVYGGDENKWGTPIPTSFTETVCKLI